LVEFVEALTIVLAVGASRGWRTALAGAFAGAIVLTVAVAALGPALARIPIASLQLFVGILLLFFGMRWLRKAILRYAGAIAFHDEAAIYAAQSARLGTQTVADGLDWSVRCSRHRPERQWRESSSSSRGSRFARRSRAFRKIS
jgi:uncharacterized membrane protein